MRLQKTLRYNYKFHTFKNISLLLILFTIVFSVDNAFSNNPTSQNGNWLLEKDSVDMTAVFSSYKHNLQCTAMPALFRTDWAALLTLKNNKPTNRESRRAFSLAVIRPPGNSTASNIDTDGDGILDVDDIDIDNDGIPNDVEMATATNVGDTDSDNITDQYDLNSDNDGISDLIEAGGTDVAGVENCSNGLDDDSDGFIDCDDTECGVTTIDYVNGQTAYQVIGQPDFISNASGTTASTFRTPHGLTLDTISGKLFISESTNNRILRFSSVESFLNGDDAEGVLGQIDFVSSSSGTTQSTFNGVSKIDMDGSGNLWVSDFTNNRILMFQNAATIGNGANADLVLGQSTYTTTTTVGRTSTRFDRCEDFHIAADGTLWLSDRNNRRILRFDNAALKSNGGAADGVLGQPDFTTENSTLDQYTMGLSQGLTIIGGDLYVGDTNNDRIMIWNDVNGKANGAAADRVLGQPDFVTNGGSTSQSSVDYPFRLFTDGRQNLYVTDIQDDRLLIFYDVDKKANGANADRVIGQNSFTSGASGTSATRLFNPGSGIFVKHEGHDVLILADGSNNRFLSYTQNLTTDEVTDISGQLNGIDQSGGGVTTFSIIDQPLIGSVVLNDVMTGDFTFTPGGTCSADVDTLLSFRYTVENAGGCSDTSNYYILQTDTADPSTTEEIVSNYNGEDISCYGGTDGIGTVEITGGTGPFTYAWTGGSTNDTLYNASAGKYYVTITDTYGCTLLDSITFTQPSSTDTDLDGISDHCDIDDDNDGILDINETGDTDSDGTPDRLDLDSDNDGCYDVVESGGTDANGDGILDGDGFNATGQVTTAGAITDGYDGVTGNEVVAVQLNATGAYVAYNQVVTEGENATLSLAPTLSATSTTDFTGTAPNTTPDYSGPSAADVSAGINYQWYLGDPDAGGTLLVGETNSTLTISNTTLAQSGTLYTLIITHDNNVCFREFAKSVLIVEPDLCDPASSGYIDSDGDGVSDYCDQDDDNDGILDVNEGGVTTQVFNRNNSSQDQFFTVPAGVYELEVKIWGAGGGGGGAGGFVYGLLPVTPGEEFTIVAGAGGNGGTYTQTPYGFNGPRISHLHRASGGGLSGIFTGSTAVTETDQARAVMIAGGGGSALTLPSTMVRPGQGGDSTFSGTMPNMIGGTASSYQSGSGGGGYFGGASEQTRLTATGTRTHGEGGSNFIRGDVTNALNLSTPDEATLSLLGLPSLYDFRVRAPYSTDSQNGGPIGAGRQNTSSFHGRVVINYSTQDTDGDGTPDRLDLDSDNDGITDLIEAGGTDTNGDGRVDDACNNSTCDTDGDGLMNSVDAAIGSGGSLLPVFDTDNDGLPDFQDLDADNDGINDIEEAGIADTDNNGIVDQVNTDGTLSADVDGDGFSDSLDPSEGGTAGITTDPDADADGLPDDDDNDGTAYNNADSDSDGIPDFRDLDSDSDGIYDVIEGGNVAHDTDGDGTIDADDTGYADTDGDGIPDTVDGLVGFGDQLETCNSSGTLEYALSNGSSNTTSVKWDGSSDQPSTDMYGMSRSTEYCESGGWRHYYNSADDDKFLFSIQMGENTTEIEYVEIRVDEFPESRYDTINTDAIFAMERDLHIQTVGGAAFNAPVNIRYYYVPTELEDMLDAAIGLADTDATSIAPDSTDIVWFSKDVYDPATDLNPDGTILTNSAGYTALTPQIVAAADGTSEADNSAFGNNVNYVQFNNITNVAGLSAYVNISGTVLPVELAYFRGRMNDCDIQLTWAAENEIAFSHYELQWSSDSRAFKTIAVLNANSGSKKYKYTHKSVRQANYYRLKLVDLDGSYEYSDVVHVQNDCDNSNLLVYPNPIGKNNGNLNIQFTSVEENVQIEITDMLGRPVLRRSLEVNPSITNSFEFQVNNLASGTYLIRIIGAHKSSRRFTIQE